MPADVIEVKICKDTLEKATKWCKSDSEIYLKEHAPKISCQKHKDPISRFKSAFMFQKYVENKISKDIPINEFVSLIKEKPNHRKEVKTYSKLESKLEDVIKFVKKEIKEGNQIFWVCPLIEESKKLDHQSAIEKYRSLNKLFPNKVGLLHGKIDNDVKEKI